MFFSSSAELIKNPTLAKNRKKCKSRHGSTLNTALIFIVSLEHLLVNSLKLLLSVRDFSSVCKRREFNGTFAEAFISLCSDIVNYSLNIIFVFDLLHSAFLLFLIEALLWKYCNEDIS